MTSKEMDTSFSISIIREPIQLFLDSHENFEENNDVFESNRNVFASNFGIENNIQDENEMRNQIRLIENQVDFVVIE